MVRVLIRKPLSIGAKARCDEVPTSSGDRLPLVSHQPNFPRPPNPFFELEPTIVNLSAIYPLSTDFLYVHASRSFHSQIKSSSSNSKSRFMEIPKISAVPKQATSRGDGDERCYTTCQFIVIWVVCAYALKILPLWIPLCHLEDKNTTQSFAEKHRKLKTWTSVAWFCQHLSISIQSFKPNRTALEWPAFNPCVVFEAMSWAMASPFRKDLHFASLNASDSHDVVLDEYSSL